MRSVFLRAVLLGVLAALALAAIRVRAETAVIICTSATEPSPLRIERDTEQGTVVVEDVARTTRELYPLSQVGSASLDAWLAQLQRDGKYQCRPGA